MLHAAQSAERQPEPPADDVAPAIES